MTKSLIVLATALAVCGCSSRSDRPQDINQPAGLRAALPYPVLDWKVLTTIADRGQVTTSTLFGNDAAVAAARANQAYPAGSVIALVTWREQNNPHWFGSRVPGDPQQVEFVEFGNGGSKYRSFAAPSFAEQPSQGDSSRLATIASLKAVPLP